MLDRPNPINMLDLYPWDQSPNSWGLPWLVRCDSAAGQVEIENAFCITIASTPYATEYQKQAIWSFNNFVADAMRYCNETFYQPPGASKDTERVRQAINYKDSLRVYDVFATVPLLKACVGLVSDRPWMSNNLKTILFSPRIQKLVNTKREALRQHAGLKSGACLSLKGTLQTSIVGGSMGVPLLTTMPVSSAAILRQEYKREQRAAAALERLDERDPSSTGAQEDLRSIIDGAHSAQQAEWRRAAPEIVARNVAWKCVVSAANACWQALDEGLGQPEHFPILVTALRQGSDDMRKILPGVNQVRRALGEPAIDLKIVENAVLAVSCFGDKTDWNHALLRADEAERAAWYKRWDQAAGRRKTASEQMALV